MRRKILDAARDLFASRATTGSRCAIADGIEYSPTAIYLHFKDKDGSSRRSATTSRASSRTCRRRPAGDPVEAPADRPRLREFGVATPTTTGSCS